ncbi:MAG: TIGR03118 family protein [Armatimonadetes bacterium]|nr:TIGR03118 family protein [Armatimonadota bacterium]
MQLKKNPLRSVAALALVASLSLPAAAQYRQHNLVSDGFVAADHIDADLVNPWGMSSSATSPFWVSNQGTGNSTLYNGLGAKQALVVNTGANPTGQVFNSTSGFLVGGAAARFMFATLGGKITAWNSGQGTVAATMVDRSAQGAAYTGLARVNDKLFAADNANGGVDVFDSSFAFQTTLTEPNLPSGYKAYGVHNIGGQVWVTYSVEEQVGGIVDVYDAAGNFVKRFATSNDLAEPWGLTVAPSTFGAFANDVLVGNALSGKIAAFDPVSGVFQGFLRDENGKDIVNTGLWDIRFGTGGSLFDKNSLYFAAGIGDELHGLVGRIDSVPEPMTMGVLAFGALSSLAVRRRSKKTSP